MYWDQAYLYRAVEMPREAILNEQGSEVEHRQKQGFELSIVGTVTHQKPRHILHCLACITENAIKAVQQIHPVVQLALMKIDDKCFQYFPKQTNKQTRVVCQIKKEDEGHFSSIAQAFHSEQKSQRKQSGNVSVNMRHQSSILQIRRLNIDTV